MECNCLFPPQNSQIYNLGGSNDSELWIYIYIYTLFYCPSQNKTQFLFSPPLTENWELSGRILVRGFEA